MIDENRINLERASKCLQAASNILGIEFYASKFDNKPAELNCRIFVMTPVDIKLIETFAKDLNESIAPVKEKLAAAMRMTAESILDGMYHDRNA